MKKSWYSAEIPGQIGKFRGLTHRVTKEVSLFGKYGEIWQAGVDKIGILITSSRLAKKELGRSGIFGDEHVVKLPLTDLSKYVKLLKVPKSLKKQLKLAGQ